VHKLQYGLHLSSQPDADHAILFPLTTQSRLPIIVLYTATCPNIHLDLDHNRKIVLVRVPSLEYRAILQPDEQTHPGCDRTK